MFYSDYSFIYFYIFLNPWIKICIFFIPHSSDFLIETILLSIYLLRFYFISISFYRIRFLESIAFQKLKISVC